MNVLLGQNVIFFRFLPISYRSKFELTISPTITYFMKKSTYLYYSPAPSIYDRRKSSLPNWVKDVLKIAILFLIGFVIS
jgi:hypothetical protein